MNDTGVATIVGGGAPSATVKTVEAVKPEPQAQHVMQQAGADTKAAARAWMNENKAAVVKNDNDLALRQKYSEASHHALSDGPAPSWLTGTPQTFAEKAAEAAANVPAGEFSPELAAQVAPIQEKDLEQLRTVASVKGLPPAEAARVVDFCLAAELPESSARTVVERAARHFNLHGDEKLDVEGHAEYLAEACRRFGSVENFRAVNDRARAYLESVNPELGRFVDEHLADSSLRYDPFVLQSLANALTRRGVN